VGETDQDLDTTKDLDTSYVADFETTTDELDCRVWLWGFCNVRDIDDWCHGNDIDSFMLYMRTYNRCHIYFHNLAFDGAFILDWLLNNGFTHEQSRNKKSPLTFSTLISKMAQFYSIKVVFENGSRVEFRDSLKKLPMSVANIAKAFKLDEGKGQLDYHLIRPVGYVPTSVELDYLRRDVQIVARALNVQLVSGMKRLTVGADSLQEYKTLIGGTKAFERSFPILCTTMDDDIRRAYRGGFTYADPRHQGTRTRAGRVYDVNSLYPSVMYDRPMPYGEPRWFTGAPTVSEDYPLFVVALTLTAKLKPDHIPCIQIKGSPHFAATLYQTDITDPVTLTCTSVDLALWNDHYDLNILSWEGGWKFHAITGFFTKYIDKWMKVKESTTGGLRFIAKLHLNSLYGKFATNPDVTPKIPILDDDNIVRLVTGDEETRNPVYTPVGVFITSYARDVTIRAAQQHYDVFAYADTDSLHLLVDSDPIGLDVHPTRLGAWKSEGMFSEAIFVRAKCYSERMIDGTHQTHIAGLPESIAKQVTLDDIVDGAVWSGKLSPHRVKGGIVLRSVDFTLNMHTNQP
jgi:hypothetical protein